MLGCLVRRRAAFPLTRGLLSSLANSLSVQAVRPASKARRAWQIGRSIASCRAEGTRAARASSIQATQSDMGDTNHVTDVYSMGPATLSVSRSKLHGAARSKLVASMRGAVPDTSSQGVVLLQGGGPFHIYATDGEMLFKQDSYFFYLFGVLEDSWYGALDVRTGLCTLFMPRLPDAYAVWMGPLKSPEHYKKMLAVDDVRYVDEMLDWLQAAAAPCLHVLQGTNTDSGTQVASVKFEGQDKFQLEADTLFDVITECRVKKLPEELAVIRYANRIGSMAHAEVMRSCSPGLMEYQLESTFLAYCYSKGGARLPMYGPIAASGRNGAILHYGHSGAPNDRQIQNGDMILVDFGCEYYHYGSDITASWPANGKFTQRQAAIYNSVLAAFNAVKQAMKPGTAWPDMHELANRKILEGLRDAGVVRGEVDDMLAADIGALFMPHGLGHFLGLDTHDVGGYMASTPLRIMRPGFKSLRTARVLEPDMVITVEPGCYFNEALLGPALQDPEKAKYLVEAAVLSYMDFGGVRIEDNVLVTATGAESFTHVPRTIEEIEAVMAGQPWEY